MSGMAKEIGRKTSQKHETSIFTITMRQPAAIHLEKGQTKK